MGRGTVARRRRADSLHVASADLHHVGVFHDRVKVFYAHHFRHDGNLFSSLASFQDLEPFEAETWKSYGEVRGL